MVVGTIVVATRKIDTLSASVWGFADAWHAGDTVVYIPSYCQQYIASRILQCILLLLYFIVLLLFSASSNQ
jgi:hypothetical protein